MKAHKIAFLLFVIVIIPWPSFGQQATIADPATDMGEKLKFDLRHAENDTLRAELLIGLSLYYLELQRDTAIYFIEQTIEMGKKYKMPALVSIFFSIMGYAKARNGAYEEALKDITKGQAIAEDPGFIKKINPFMIKGLGVANKEQVSIVAKAMHKRQLGNLYRSVDNNKLAMTNYLAAMANYNLAGRTQELAEIKMNIGEYYYAVDSLDMAMKYYKESLNDFENVADKKYLGAVLLGMADIYVAKGKNELAKSYYSKAVENDEKTGNQSVLIQTKIHLGKLLLKEGDYTSAIKIANEGLAMAQKNGMHRYISEANLLLASCYRAMKDFEKADQFAQLGDAISDSLQTAHQGNIAKFHNAILEENIRNNEKELKQISTQYRRRSYAFITGLLLLSIIGLLLYRNNRQKQKSNRILQKTLSNLKSAQSQLIQSEKMASLGELTAGIAHEIQNPLNFVNNFSEVSSELLDEMQEELEKRNTGEAIALAGDIKQNLEKIIHHGKRADGIVKAMLQHSRSSSGIKEPTDMNALADEYLRLAYHGLRAKDKSFNATLKTEFDESLGKINVVPQDMGRVILNLLTNAFYAVNERKKASHPPGGEQYEPMVILKTSYLPPSEKATRPNDPVGRGGACLISVSDNGGGIPQAEMDKIFQPFFTTKPTGKGTGLGLSMSYEIVTKGHGGELKVENKEGEGVTFTVILPVKK